MPILVGGTGLYFKALTEGLAAVPPIPADIRAEIRGRLVSEGVGALYAELAAGDPETAGRVKPNDRARVTRALEVVDRDRAFAERLARRGAAARSWQEHETIRVFLTPERAALYRRIETRFDRDDGRRRA